MKKCYIITGVVEGNVNNLIKEKENSLIICADSGYDFLTNTDIKADYVIGDMDSIKRDIPYDINTVKLNKDKDFSDTFEAIKLAIDKKVTHLIIIGGISKRIDHSISNIQTIFNYYDNFESIEIIDKGVKIIPIVNNTIKIKGNKEDTFSIFSFSNKSNISIRGSYFDVLDLEIKNNTPIGLSNRFKDKSIDVTVENGKCILIKLCKGD